MSAHTDISSFLAGLTEAERRIAAPAVARGVTRAAAKILTDATRLAPVGGGIYSPHDPQPGRLKDSATQADAQVNGHTVTVEIGFNEEYAAVQHERLDFRHDQGQAKFLETSLRANQNAVPAAVAAELRKALG